MAAVQDLRYRRDIDGLRAIAILAVVFYHAGFGPSGGYVGVDVFFVISGFLITSLIWSRLESGRFTFVDFWERRARRIVPALVVVTLATLVAGWFILLPSGYQDLGWAAASQAVFGANFYYWLTSDYFAHATSEQPLIHTWSLAVEEQFYLIAPVLLWAAYRSRILRGRIAALALVTTCFLASLALSIYALPISREATFYLLPTRAWELLSGSLVAFLPSKLLLGRRFLREILSFVGLELILLAIFTYTSDTPFPGASALLPCLGSAFLIWANGREEGEPPTIVARLLSLGPIVFFGLISYSFYLWHCPFLAFPRYLELDPLSAGYRLAMVASAFLCALLTWKYVETPFRQRRLATTRNSLFIYAGAGLGVVFTFGMISLMFRGIPQRFSPEILAIASAEFDLPQMRYPTLEEIKTGKLPSLGVSDSTRATVFIWGDSHALAAMPALDSVLKKRGLRGLVAFRGATAPVVDWPRAAASDSRGAKISCAIRNSCNTAVLNYISTHHFDDVILIARWRIYTGGFPPPATESIRPFDTALLATVRALAATGCRPWVVLDVPEQSFNVPKALTSSIYTSARISLLCSTPAKVDPLDGIDPRIIAEIKAAGGRIIDPKPRFIDPSGQFYQVQAGKVIIYRDSNHLTQQGARLILQPFFDESLAFSLAN